MVTVLHSFICSFTKQSTQQSVSNENQTHRPPSRSLMASRCRAENYKYHHCCLGDREATGAEGSPAWGLEEVP